MIKAKYGWVVQALIMSVSMGFVMSLVMTLVNVGLRENFHLIWLKAFGIGLTVSVPTGMIVGPFARKITRKLTKQ
ncbi:MAG: DUF2798 domain-containing protein [Chitinispirillaceae bacterium]